MVKKHFGDVFVKATKGRLNGGNYEIFERRPSIVLAIDGNSACANLIQEAKNGKAKALIYVSGDSEILKAKAMSLIGYVNIYYNSLDIKIMIKKFKRKARENGGI